MPAGLSKSIGEAEPESEMLKKVVQVIVGGFFS
jgi:hypothetical protein